MSQELAIYMQARPKAAFGAGLVHGEGLERSGRTHARTHVIMLIHEQHIRVVHATAGELLRELILDLNRDYQLQKRRNGPNP